MISFLNNRYARDTLSTHAIGDEALVRLNVDDLEGILGSRHRGKQVLRLYSHLIQQETMHNEFLRQHKHGLSLTGTLEGHNDGDTTSTTTDINGSNSGNGNNGSGDGNSTLGGSEMSNAMPLDTQMALAINALSQQLCVIAKAVVSNEEERAKIVPIQISFHGNSGTSGSQFMQNRSSSQKLPLIMRQKSRDQLEQEVRMNRSMGLSRSPGKHNIRTRSPARKVPRASILGAAPQGLD